MPRIPFVDLDTIDHPEVLGYLEDARRRGRPGPDMQAIRAHHPGVLRSFSTTWEDVYDGGVVDDSIKQLCRIYVSKTIGCTY